MNILSPSILAADFWRLGEQIREVEQTKVPYLHFDVMDGCFVPSISFGMPLLSSIRSKTDLFLDVHLMIEQPERYVDTFADCGADLINFHLESTKDAKTVIQKIRKTGKKVGITIKPGTMVCELLPYLDQVDMVLVMTVEPGFGGQKMIPSCLDKVRELYELRKQRDLTFDIEVDGGVTQENVEEFLSAGANVIVAGSAVFRGDITANINSLLEKM